LYDVRQVFREEPDERNFQDNGVFNFAKLPSFDLTTASEHDLHSLNLELSGRVRDSFLDLVQTHQKCVRVDGQLSLDQTNLLKGVIVRAGDFSEVDISYVSSLRKIVEQKLAEYIHLGKRLFTVEELVTLQKTISKRHQKVSARNVEFYPQGV